MCYLLPYKYCSSLNTTVFVHLLSPFLRVHKHDYFRLHPVLTPEPVFWPPSLLVELTAVVVAVSVDDTLSMYEVSLVLSGSTAPFWNFENS